MGWLDQRPFAPVGVYAWICDYKKVGATGIAHLKGTVALLR